jgi:anthranilate synthase component 1
VTVSPRRATPHVREFLADSLTPLGVYRRLARLSPLRFLFESVSGGEQVSRFSFLGAAPRQVVRVYPDRLEIVPQRGGIEVRPGDPLARLAEVVGAIDAAPGPIPFTGGWVGYFGYELVRLLERLPTPDRDPFALPVALLARYDTLVVFDHARQRVLAIANEIDGEVSMAAAERDLARLARLLTAPGGSGAVSMPDQPPPVGHTQVSLDGARFRAAVERAKEHIRAGDIFQVVLARRWRVPARVEPLALYRALRMVNPSPYMVLLETPEVALVGASPEMLVRKTGHRIETRPIAGTRPRGADPDGDRRLAQDLLADPKERAEHVMLVDLGRNDLGRVAVPGTVRVAELMAVERYSHVMHLVSAVEADLDPRRSALDALFAAFPAGTVSGAPKIRAMEIIRELEPEARGPYAGAVGYLGFSGDLDTCITIRTLVVRDGEVSVTAGAGIVADSVPENEERETENKAAALLAAVGLAEGLAEQLAGDGGGELSADGPVQSPIDLATDLPTGRRAPAEPAGGAGERGRRATTGSPAGVGEVSR